VATFASVGITELSSDCNSRKNEQDFKIRSSFVSSSGKARLPLFKLPLPITEDLEALLPVKVAAGDDAGSMVDNIASEERLLLACDFTVESAVATLDGGV
jgi:hypothetical protein